MSGGKSKSSTTNTSTTANTDSRVAATDSAIAVGGEGTLNLDMTSPEAWAALDGVLTEAGAISRSALDILGANTQKVVEFFDKQASSEETGLAAQAMKLALPVALVAVGAWALSRK